MTQYAKLIFEDIPKSILNVYTHMNVDYFVGSQVAKLLGYKTATTLGKSVSEQNKTQFRNYLGIKEPTQDPRTILINKEGFNEIVSKTKKKISQEAIQILLKYNISLPSQKQILIEHIKVDSETKDINPEDILTYSYISNHLCFEYFVGYQITALLGYKNPTTAVDSIVSKCNQLPFREYPGVKTPILDSRTILITRDGAVEILLKTRKRISPDVLYLLKKFGIDTTNRKCLTKEQQTLSSITNAFKTEKYEEQFKIGSYYLDLYFPVYRLVIECDENGHTDRRPSDERERMDFVNKELEIDDENWIRFNPDEKDFDVSTVIGKIYMLMKMKGVWVTKYTNPNRYLKNINLDPEKPCNKCGIVKPLEEFNKAFDHRDGVENVCKICRRKRQEEVIEEKRLELDLDNLTEKECNVCKESKELDDFYKDKQSPDGYMRKCKKCTLAIRKKNADKPKIIITEKKCTSCSVTKYISEYYKRKVSPDGYAIYCKCCAKKKAKEIYLVHGEKYLAKKKEKRKERKERNIF